MKTALFFCYSHTCSWRQKVPLRGISPKLYKSLVGQSECRGYVGTLIVGSRTVLTFYYINSVEDCALHFCSSKWKTLIFPVMNITFLKRREILDQVHIRLQKYLMD